MNGVGNAPTNKVILFLLPLRVDSPHKSQLILITALSKSKNSLFVRSVFGSRSVQLQTPALTRAKCRLQRNNISSRSKQSQNNLPTSTDQPKHSKDFAETFLSKPVAEALLYTSLKAGH